MAGRKYFTEQLYFIALIQAWSKNHIIHLGQAVRKEIWELFW